MGLCFGVAVLAWMLVAIVGDWAVGPPEKADLWVPLPAVAGDLKSYSVALVGTQSQRRLISSKKIQKDFTACGHTCTTHANDHVPGPFMLSSTCTP